MSDLFVIPIQELLQKSIIGLGMLAIIDFGWAYNTKARYFALHGLWNMIITILTLPDMYYTLLDPINAIRINNDPTRWPIIFVTMIHLWHCVAYSNLTWDDYFHHGFFVITLCSFNFIWEWGYATSFIIFFICGFPGGVDYLMLLAVKHEYINKLTEKKWNKILNIWCRGPGCIASACLIWINWLAGTCDHIPAPVKFITILLAIFNGQYYSKRVVVSWVNHSNAARNVQDKK